MRSTNVWAGLLAVFACIFQIGCSSGEPLTESQVEAPRDASSRRTLTRDEALLKAAREVLPDEISMRELQEELGKGLWNTNHTALAISLPTSHSSPPIAFVFLAQPNGTFLPCDISGVEDGNLGKLGIAGRASYDRLKTKPTKWLQRNDSYFQVLMQTQAWKGGQRFTVAEPLVIRKDGFVVYR